MRNPGGYAVIVDPNAPLREHDTFTCAHCNSIVLVTAGCDASEAGGFCRLCYKHICGPCADKGACEPFEKKLEAMERRDRFMKAMR